MQTLMCPRLVLTLLLLGGALQAQDWTEAHRHFRAELGTYLQARKELAAIQEERAQAQQTLDRAIDKRTGKMSISQSELDRLKGILQDADLRTAAASRKAEAAAQGAGAALRGQDRREAVQDLAILITTVEEALYVAEALSGLEDLRSPGALDEMTAQLRSSRTPRLSRALCRTLWRTTEDRYRGAVYAALSDRDPSKIIAALDAIEFAPDGEPFEKAMDLMAHEVWQVRVAAVEMLGRSVVAENEERIVLRAIQRVGEEEGRVMDDLVRFLSHRMQGANGGRDPEAWAQLWDNFKHDRATGELEDPDRTVSTYYGIPIYSKRVVFVLDTSGSMAHPHGIQRESKPPAPDVVITDSGRDKDEEEEKKRRELDWSKITTKIELAKAELIRTLEELDEDVQFSIVTYSSGVKVLSEQLVPATQKNKQKFIGMIKDLPAAGSTNAFFESVIAGMDCAVRGGKKPKGPAGGKAQLVGGFADTIYFLTDGSPTIGNGETIMPDDQVRQNMARLREHYELRKVAINTIGIGPHAVHIMDEIARMTGGTYVDLSR